MKKTYTILGILIGILVGTPVMAQADVQGDIKTLEVAKSIYMLEGKGGNIGVSIGEDGILIVDDKFSHLVGKIRASLSKLSKGKLEFILNTHWHGDHTGGNEAFGGEATIIAHNNVRKRLSSKQTVKLFNMVSEPHPKVALPVITFDQSLSVHFNGEEIKLIHFSKGHTDGDSVIFFTESNVVHLGDHFFNGMYPFIDLDSGGNVEGFITNIEKLLTLIPKGAKIIPGHGPLADIGDLKDFHAMLLETSAIVTRAISQNKSLEEIQKEGFPEEIINKWSKGALTTEQWIEIIYRSFS